jgi:all-trans-retinol 13,14-reductase
MIAGEHWDVICVGSGITSLAFACELLRLYPRLKVLVLEKHSVAGGYASEFSRPKFNSRFDCSLHKLSGMGPLGNLRKTLDEMGVLDCLEFTYEKVFFEASFSDAKFSISSASEQAQLDLIAVFPLEASGIRAFFREVEVHGRNLYMQFRAMLGEFQPNIEELRYAHKNLRALSVLDGIRRHVSDPDLIEILAMPVQYVGGFSEEVSYPYFLHIVYACQFMQCAYVKGGAQRLSNLLVKNIQDRGGRVMLDSRVERVLLDDAEVRAVGVETKSGKFSANHVVVNAAPSYALDNLFSGYASLAGIRENLRNLQPANATTTIYLVTDVPPEELGFDRSETWIISEEVNHLPEYRALSRRDPSDAAKAEYAYWENSTIEVTNYHSLDPNGGHVLLINTLDDIGHWPERKTNEYRSKKKKALSVLLNRLYDHKPGLQGHVIYSEVSSPRTCLRYTNNSAGSGYGARVSSDQAGHGFHYRFPVTNVSFMSAWVAGSGYEAGIGYASIKAKGFHHYYDCK